MWVKWHPSHLTGWALFIKWHPSHLTGWALFIKWHPSHLTGWALFIMVYYKSSSNSPSHHPPVWQEFESVMKVVIKSIIDQHVTFLRFFLFLKLSYLQFSRRKNLIMSRLHACRYLREEDKHKNYFT